MSPRKFLITTRRLADALNVKPAVIYTLARQSKIPFYRVGGRYRFDEDEVFAVLKDASIASHENKANTQ